jgi:hypothetical protein
LERQSVPPGTLILIGSASHLQHVGSTIFAQDWCQIVELLSEKLKNVKVIPCIPILREDGPGSLGRQFIEIAHWFDTVYEKNPLGCLPAWNKLVEVIGKTDEDGLDLGFTDFYTVALPQSLSTSSILTPVKFCHSSSHTTVRGVDSVTSDELLRTLLDLLQTNFASVANSDEILSREPATQVPSDKEFTHCIIAGGSNMKRLCPHLTKLGITVLDLTKQGWTPTEANILALANEIREIPDTTNIPVIMDLLGNFAFRYEQTDGTQALPFKMGGKYHFDGKVITCSHSLIRSAIGSLKPVFDAIKGPSLFCCPYPRCLYNGCCLEDGHCPGVDTAPYVTSLLDDTLALRAVCKSAISEMGQNQMWVPDIVRKLLPACNDTSELAAGLKYLFSADGVHFTDQGYEKIAHVLAKSAAMQLSKKQDSASIPLSGAKSGPSSEKPGNYYWRGFLSPVGSARPKNPNSAYLSTHQGAGGKWKGYPVNVGRGSSRGRGESSRGGHPRGDASRGNAPSRGNPRSFPYYRRN